MCVCEHSHVCVSTLNRRVGLISGNWTLGTWRGRRAWGYELIHTRIGYREASHLWANEEVKVPDAL